MKLLSKTQAQATIKRDNDELIETNIRLRKFWKEITERLNTVRENYDPDKQKALNDFELFVKDIQTKKTKLLGEVVALEKLIADKKEIYYGLIEKQDRLEERVYQANEKEKKLDLREAFITDLETKWRNKTS
jgi:predicted RNase H-like nuclease (RuvC/YqgF family)